MEEVEEGCALLVLWYRVPGPSARAHGPRGEGKFKLFQESLFQSSIIDDWEIHLVNSNNCDDWEIALYISEL